LFGGPLRFEFGGEGQDFGCTAWTTRKDTGERIDGVKITRAMVQAEGWSSNKKWQSMEKQMFQYRAAAFFGRVHCPELLMGYHTADEIEDVGMRDITSKASNDNNEATDYLAAAVGGAR
jgi:hypothetical protein